VPGAGSGSRSLPARAAAQLVEAAEGAFVLGLQAAAAVGAAAIAATAIAASVLLRRQAADTKASRGAPER
jgi:MFS transporter, DHA2 family, multidrug resistance protein